MEKESNNALVFLDCCRFTELCCSRSIQIKAYQPNSNLVQHFTFLFLGLRQRGRNVMQIQIGSNPSKKKDKKRKNKVQFTKAISQKI